MIEEHFLSLDRNDKCPYEIAESAQIEPGSPEDPDELMRMVRHKPNGDHLIFDAVFFPDHVQIQTVGGGHIADILNDSVESDKELYQKLESLDIYSEL